MPSRIALSPSGPLRAFLDAHAGRLLAAPLVLTRGPVGFSARSARLGTAADALEVFAMDAALGIGLADRARRACGDLERCVLVVEGYWRGLVDGALQLDVVRVVEGAAQLDVVSVVHEAS